MTENALLSREIQYLKGIGEKRAKLFASLGIRTVGELINYFPRGYEDWSKTVDIAAAPIGENVCVRVTVCSDITASGTHTGKTIYGTIVRDDTAFLSIGFFNNKFIQHMIHDGDELYLYGKILLSNRGDRQMFSPEFVPASEKPRLRAVYPLTAGVTSKMISTAVETALSACGDKIPESLPDEQIKKYRLARLRDAIRMIHFPSSQAEVDAARRRLCYEELLVLQLGMLRRGKGEKLSTDCVISKDYSHEFEARFPYPLTNAQKNAISQCISDMKRTTPMCRLLQGDVGSGKTAVAASLIYSAVKNGYQCVLMAPTEVLANQHYKTFSALFEGVAQVALLTGSVTAKNKRLIKEKIATGETQIVIGTHAVITDDTLFSNLGLVITDEQHRFGVMQRAALRQKGRNPHVLVMSATPIPRTLSLIIYGDLDVCILDEKPVGRLPVKTYKVPSSYHNRLYGFLKKEVDAGRQCYIVCPLVEESESFTSFKLSAENYINQLKNTALSGVRLGLLHGKMKQKEKDAVMAAFVAGEIDILVCTVVIEVGIDVPNSSVIVIENAESFGLSQLHQLRGRVGRGKNQSYCILVSDAQNKEALTRLDVMCATEDGFKIADEDLKLRGPGDFFGARQSGLPQLAIADMIQDSKILYAAGREAAAILKKDPLMKSPAYTQLRLKTEAMFTDIS